MSIPMLLTGAVRPLRPHVWNLGVGLNLRVLLAHSDLLLAARMVHSTSSIPLHRVRNLSGGEAPLHRLLVVLLDRLMARDPPAPFDMVY